MAPTRRTLEGMSELADQSYEVIHLGGQAAAIVPLDELRRLKALERHVSPEVLEDAEVEAALAAHDEWVAAGCPGALSHEEAMAILLKDGA
jgi:predicted amino acid dehydrogenase